MKKLILALAVFVLLPAAGFAQDQRELLLTGDGQLFIAEQKPASSLPEIASRALTLITVSVRHDEEQQELVVPGTLEAGIHANPALAYDDASQTLFVFWQRSASLMHSELLFQSLGPDRTWGPVTAFGSVQNSRENLRIAVTRKAHVISATDGTETVVPQINVHAVWWEFDLHDGVQSARYAMLAIEEGAVVETSVHNLFEFVPAPESVPANLGDINPADIFKHPALFVSPQKDSVTVLFGDARDSSFGRVRIHPWKYAGEARVHIPVGRHEGRKLAAPKLVATDGMRVGTVGTTDGNVALYTTNGEQFRYVVLRDEAWTDARELRLDESLNTDAAVRAVRRLVEHE